MFRTWLLVGLLACTKSTPPPVASNTAPREPVPDAAAEITACARYYALEPRIAECAALSEETRQEITQRETDMGATIRAEWKARPPSTRKRSANRSSSIYFAWPASPVRWSDYAETPIGQLTPVPPRPQ